MQQWKSPERPIAIRVEDIFEFHRDWLRVEMAYLGRGGEYWVALAQAFRTFCLVQICLNFEGAIDIIPQLIVNHPSEFS